ncbi:MAG TPA: glycosyltransferase family 2 protein [Candidatus Binatus sp.]|nr:glycosyltransferase family 2 protein [Candidatus Binatus sp.]
MLTSAPRSHSASHHLSVIIPAYNEERGIEAILHRVAAQRDRLRTAGVTELQVIVVDDGSQDGTAARVATHPGVRLVRHRVNQGYGAALKTGFSQAAGDLLAFLDADGTYPPESLPDLCREALRHDADLVVGSRMLGAENHMPLVRRMGNALFASLLSVVSTRRVSDSTSGMRVLKQSALPALYPLPDGLDFTPVMSVRALYEGLRVAELPIPYGERVGQSKLAVAKDGVRFLRSIMWTAALYNPLGIFGAFGLALLFVACVWGVPPILYYLHHRSVPEDSIYRLLTVLIVSAAGINMGVFGLMSAAILNLLPGRRVPRPLLPKRLQRALAWAGLALLLAGLALVAPSGVEWLETSKITRHWSYFAAGGTLILAGLQLGTWFALLTMAEDLVSGPDRVRRDSRLE